MKAGATLLALLIAAPALAQQSKLAADFSRERTKIAESCGALRKIFSCAVTLVTGYPLHIALGSIAPTNGFAFGAAFVQRYTPSENWKVSFSADAVRSVKASWRAGTYLTLIRTKVPLPGVGTGAATSSTSDIREYPVIRLYWQHMALERLTDFGPNFDAPAPRNFTQAQTIIGGNVVLPLKGTLSLAGGANARFITIDKAPAGDSFFEVVEDLRFRPAVFGDRLKFNYSLRLQQFLGGGDASFHRWTIDLRHDVPIYRTATSTGPAAFNGPNECFQGPGNDDCPEVSYSRNLSGTVSARLLAVSSTAFDNAGVVPFYLQPTIGGRDIDNRRILAGFENYRFRAPHVFAGQLTLEHSIWGPIGAFVMAEGGKATPERDLTFRNWRASYSLGLTVRAGGAPMIHGYVASAGGNRRFVLMMETSLLGGSSRPSSY